jgi:hypothetical protein
MSLKLKFKDQDCRNYDAALGKFVGTEINSAKTSSIPLAQFWKDTATRLSVLDNHLGFGLVLENSELRFEYPTAPGQGKGKSSMTDLMISPEKAKQVKIAVEAKYTEYAKAEEKTVEKWLLAGDNPANRQQVLQGWWNMIAPFRTGNSTPDTIGYQFLHRTASASTGAQQAIVVYQIFYDEYTLPFLQDFKNRLQQYARIINSNGNLTFYTWEIEAKLLIPDKTNPNPFTVMKTQNVYAFGKTDFYQL